MQKEKIVVPVVNAVKVSKKEKTFQQVLKEYLRLFGNPNHIARDGMSGGDVASFALAATQVNLDENQMNFILIKNFMLYKNNIAQNPNIDIKSNNFSFINCISMIQAFMGLNDGMQELDKRLTIDPDLKQYLQKCYIIYQIQSNEFPINVDPDIDKKLQTLASYMTKSEQNKKLIKK